MMVSPRVATSHRHDDADDFNEDPSSCSASSMASTTTVIVTPNLALHAKKRIHDDAPLPTIVDPKKTCLDDDHGESSSSNINMNKKARDEQNLQWMHAFQRGQLTVLDAITQSGSIDGILHLLEFLFETNRVETFCLDILLDFWEYFPEAAQSQLYLFAQYGCWQQLLLLMERAGSQQRKDRVADKIGIAILAILKDQWAADLEALSFLQNDNNDDGTTTSTLSDLALWLPREGSRWDLKLDFTRRFSRLVVVNPRMKILQNAKERYRKQLTALRKSVMAQRHHQLSSSPTYDNNHEMLHVVSVGSLRSECSHQNSPARRKRDTKPLFQHSSCFPSFLSFAPNGIQNEASENFELPTEGRVDQFLYLQRNFRLASESFLLKPIRSFDRHSAERILYIHQGEVGYAVPSQCDVILSDKATTCHILSMQSTCSSSTTLGVPTLASLVHIDGSFYHQCMEEMIEAHVHHHMESLRLSHQTSKIHLLIDVVGGFDDDRGASAEISTWLLHTLSYLAEAFRDVLTMSIRTCAISLLNDDGYCNPIGRGMGIDLRTGEAFLAKADSAVVGPALQLRSARIWAGEGDGRLAVVHSASTSSNDEFVIHPFEFGVFAQLHEYLRLPDQKMIRRTSTSPDAEEPDFCASVRNTLRFMKNVECQRVFGPNLDQPLVYRRVGSSNVWKRTSS